MANSEAEKPRRTISYLLLTIILVTIALSAVALYQAFIEYAEGGDGISLLLIGGLGFALSAYMLFQTRRKTMRLEIKEQPVTTTILCPKCGFKNVRDFQRGDYIFKETDPCPKCNEKMSVASIYREVEEKH